MIKSILLVIGGAIITALAGGAVSYFWIRHHNFTARGNPSGVEAYIAEAALSISVPSAAKSRKSPFSKGVAAAAVAGQGLFVQKCALCHGYDGSGKTQIGAGQYPHPPDLRGRRVQSMSDGELFYVIQNGIRYTGMPAWTMTDEDTWHLVAYVRQLTAARE